MRILYKNKTASQQFDSKYQRKWTYPKVVKEKVLATENFILQANSLQDIFSYPPFRFHSLSGKRKDEWSLYLGNTGYRVTLIPCDEDGNSITEGDILAQCKSILVVMVTEVSNHYGQ